MFRDEPIQKARPENVILAEALYDLLEARGKLTKAADHVPGYTAQHSPKDYYAEEQHNYNQAVDAYADAVRALVASKPTDMATYYEHQKALDTPITEIFTNEKVVWAFHDTGLWYFGDVFRHVSAGVVKPNPMRWDRLDSLFPGYKSDQRIHTRTLINKMSRTYQLPLNAADLELEKWVRPEENK